MEIKRKLSLLWTFVTLNYIYCDIMTLMDPAMLNELLTGNVNGMDMDNNFLLGASVLMEIPIAMIVLSRLLNYKTNRWTNIIAGCLKTIVMVITLFIGIPTSYYLFFGIIEIITTIIIVYCAWEWKNTEPDSPEYYHY